MRKKKEEKEPDIPDQKIHDLSKEKRMLKCILKDELKGVEVFYGLKKENEVPN